MPPGSQKSKDPRLPPQRDAKIDTIYVELRQEQAAHLDEIYKRHGIELKQKEAEMRRCDIRKCDRRQPPSGY